MRNPLAQENAWHRLRYDFGSPVEVTGYVVKSRNANEAMNQFEWQGSNDGETWTTIENRAVQSWGSHDAKVFIVGSPIHVSSLSATLCPSLAS